MLFKTKLKVGLSILLFVVIFACFYFYKTTERDIKVKITDRPMMVQHEKETVTAEISADRGELLENLDPLKGHTITHAEIEISGKAPVEKLEIAAPKLSKIELDDKVFGKNFNNLGVSITNTGEMNIFSATPENEQAIRQGEMVTIENLGWPRGADFKAQPVKSIAREDRESQELKFLEERRSKRKSNFAKSLEERAARKILYKTRP